jgi:hypothetical protein
LEWQESKRERRLGSCLLWEDKVTVCGVIAGGSVTVKGANVSRMEYIAVPNATVGMLVVKITKHSLL